MILEYERIVVTSEKSRMVPAKSLISLFLFRASGALGFLDRNRCESGREEMSLP